MRVKGKCLTLTPRPLTPRRYRATPNVSRKLRVRHPPKTFPVNRHEMSPLGEPLTNVPAIPSTPHFPASSRSHQPPCHRVGRVFSTCFVRRLYSRLWVRYSGCVDPRWFQVVSIFPLLSKIWILCFSRVADIPLPSNLLISGPSGTVRTLPGCPTLRNFRLFEFTTRCCHSRRNVLIPSSPRVSLQPKDFSSYPRTPWCPVHDSCFVEYLRICPVRSTTPHCLPIHSDAVRSPLPLSPTNAEVPLCVEDDERVDFEVR